MEFNSLTSPDDPCVEPDNALLLVVSVNGVAPFVALYDVELGWSKRF